MSNGIVAIVGRPNVGKSTFFNRLVEKREAIEDSFSGVTRDRNYGKSDWNGKYFSVIDTGGYIVGSEDVFEKEIRKQVILAIEEADIILFLVDGEAGILPSDSELSKILYKTTKPVLLVVNKIDNVARQNNTLDFYSLGFEKVFGISAINGSGTGNLLDEVVELLPEKELQTENTLPSFAVVGKPNSGKSSFINTLLGEERYIVTSIAGTTRDSINTNYNLYGFNFDIIDTAGIRRKSKVKENVEFYSVLRSIRSIEKSDVCLILFDIEKGFDAQVQKIFWLAYRNKKGVVLLANKWDLIDKESINFKQLENEIREQMAPFTDVPILFISVLKKQRIFKAIELAIEVYKRRSNRITTHKLNDLLLPIIQKTPPPIHKGKQVKIKFCSQLITNVSNPQFLFFCNLPQYVKESYKRFLENKIRNLFDFTGVPIDIYFRKK